MYLKEAPLFPDAAIAPGPDLYPWDINPAVAEVQELLNAHGFDLIVDGDFNWKTETAVKTYQRQYGLRVDGIVGAETWRTLKATVKPGARTLREGLSGVDVYELQGLLQVQGHVVQQDGIFGPETRSAVMAFQAAHHMRIDGTVAPVTWAFLTEKGTIFQKRRR
ncbi:MAG: hypothetical protein Kow00121_35450 [Elainellaceae cyanobacterium]